MILVLAALVSASLCCVEVEAVVSTFSVGEQDDDGSRTFKLPLHTKHTANPSLQGRSYILRMPDHVVKLSERAKAMNVDVSFDIVPNHETSRVKSTTSRLGSSTMPQIDPYLRSGLAALAIGSFVSTNHGFKALKELAVGSMSALALVWVPTLLINGGWLEFLSAVSFLTHPTSRRFVIQKLIPKIMGTLKKLFLTEMWRRVWSIVLAPLPKPLLVPSDGDILRIHWLPDYAKEGILYFRDKVDAFVLSTFKGSVQKSIYSSLGIFYDSVSSTVMEVSLYEEAMEDDDSPDLIEANDDDDDDGGDLSDDDSDGDMTDEPQMVCDGDVCWLE